MSKYLLKFAKHILPSSKNWTGVGLLSYRDVYLCSTTSRKDMDIVLYIVLVLKSQKQLQERLTTNEKEPPAIKVFWAFAKKPELDC
jgi:hypothetical protein